MYLHKSIHVKRHGAGKKKKMTWEEKYFNNFAFLTKLVT